MAGINRAKPTPMFESYSLNKSANQLPSRPCIFLSHISVDKEAAIQIGDYITNYADIDIYLDIYDNDLQQAAILQDPVKITDFIESGISKSTHAMCLISQNTAKSWWVPYELGFAKKAGKSLCSLKLKGDVQLPEFLSISDILHGTRSLNQYIEKVVKTWESRNSLTSKIEIALESHSSMSHPLDKYLDWKE
jgi:hypothetical protein